GHLLHQPALPLARDHRAESEQAAGAGGGTGRARSRIKTRHSDDDALRRDAIVRDNVIASGLRGDDHGVAHIEAAPFGVAVGRAAADAVLDGARMVEDGDDAEASVAEL